MIRVPIRLLLTLLFLLPIACRPEAPPAATAVDQLIIGITADGLYRLTLADLQAAGLAVAVLAVDQVHLSQAGAPVPYLLQDDALIFYGRASDSRYTAIRPYLLQTGRPGQLMAEAIAEAAAEPSPAATAPVTNSVTRTLRLEENNLYHAQALDAVHTDPWFWQRIGRGQVVEIPLELAAVSNGAGQLRLQLWGQTHSPEVENDHDLELLLNGRALQTILWDGPTYHEATITLPPGTLQAGRNTITLSNEAPGAVLIDIMLLNWLELAYTAPPTAAGDELSFTADQAMTVTLSGFTGAPVTLDVQNPDSPVLLRGPVNEGAMTLAVNTGAQVLAVGPQGFGAPYSLEPARQSTWRDHQNQADLLIITTDALAPALQPLAAAREEQGVSTAIVPVAEIYDAFAAGQKSPESIQKFVAYAAANWQRPGPRYLLLVGEATIDYRGDGRERRPAHLVPPLLVPVFYSGETVSDARLADIDDDGKPDLAVGRWPVDSVRALESLVQRTLAYESGTAVPHALFITDASEDQFATMAQRLWTGAGLPQTAVTHLHGPSAAEVVAAWNTGAWLATYIGHGSLELWGKESLFHPAAVAGWNKQQPPIVIQFTCLTGLFAQPGVQSLAEVMIQHDNGPVLTVAATSLTLSTHQEPFAAALLQNLANPEFARMGDAFHHAQISLNIEDDGLREISDTFVLLGDPSARIVRP